MAETDPLVGRKLGRCVLAERIGGGGMGSVYRARHEVLDKDVVVKVIAPSLRGDQQFVQRLLREAKLAAKIDHPGVVTVQDAGVEDGMPYLVMPYVRGKSLDAILDERKRLKPAEALAAVKKAARALAAAHRLGIVHRDIKPGNLMATVDGQIKVTDFGLAVALGSADPRLTRADSVVGSPHYMAPEQVSGGTIDARSDIYALGATLYTLIAGETPYGGGTAFSIAMKHASDDARPRPLREAVPGIAPEAEAVVDRMMAKRPEDRYPDMEAVVRAIDAVQGAARESGAPVAAAASAPTLVETPTGARAGAAAGRPVAAPTRPGASTLEVAVPAPAPARRRWPWVAAACALVLLVLLLAARGPSKAQRALVEADRFAAAASAPEAWREAARRYGAVTSDFPGTKEAATAEERRQDYTRRAEEGERAARAREALAEAERVAGAASGPPGLREAAQRLARVAREFPGTPQAHAAQKRSGEIERRATEAEEALVRPRRALDEAERFANGASTPETLREAARRFAKVAADFPRHREGEQADVRRREIERRLETGDEKPALDALRALDTSTPRGRAALEDGVEAFLARTPPPSAAGAAEARRIRADAFRRALEARVDALFERIRKDNFWNLSVFFDPETVKGVGERIAVNFAMTAAFNALKQAGWRLESWTLDDVAFDPERRRATVRLRLHLGKDGTAGMQDHPDTQTWVVRRGEWYLVPEDKKKPQ